MPVEICVRLEFDSAHRLYPYEGKCANIHGHNYRVDVGVVGELDHRGIVADFGDLKNHFSYLVDSVLDHTLILNSYDPLVAPLSDLGVSMLLLEGSPTAENIAQYIFEEFETLLSNDELKLSFVRVYETDNNYAEYR